MAVLVIVTVFVISLFRNGWVLHGRAMKRPVLTDKYLAVDAHDFPVWEALLKCVGSQCVGLGMSVSGVEDSLVDNEEIGVCGWQSGLGAVGMMFVEGWCHR